MPVLINNPIQSTIIFFFILLMALALTIKKKANGSFFSLAMTEELKGIAILMVIFSHLGYFLVSDHRFLWPLSIFAGVGVNLFLFLSGFGLSISGLKKDLSVRQFYQSRLSKLMPPLWVVLIIILILDWVVLKIHYPWTEALSAFFGYFPQADLVKNINSPLWYITLTLFYYLIFPWLFNKRHIWFSAIGIYLVSWLIVFLNPSWLSSIIGMYRLHLLAFPLGVLFVWLIQVGKKSNLLKRWKNYLFESKTKLQHIVHYVILIALCLGIAYLGIHSGVGQGVNLEQWLSVATMFLFIFLFLLKRLNFGLLSLLGGYSYEIYLIHWPLASRYYLIFHYLPGWLAMVVYLAVLLGLSWLLRKIIKLIIKSWS